MTVAFTGVPQAGARSTSGPPTSASYAGGTLTLHVNGVVTVTCRSGAVHVDDDGADVAVTPSAPPCADVTHVVATGTASSDDVLSLTDTSGASSLTALTGAQVDLGTGYDQILLPPVQLTGAFAGDVVALGEVPPPGPNPNRYLLDGRAGGVSVFRNDVQLTHIDSASLVLVGSRDAAMRVEPSADVTLVADSFPRLARVDDYGRSSSTKCQRETCFLGIAGTKGLANLASQTPWFVYDFRFEHTIPASYARLLGRMTAPSSAEVDGWLRRMHVEVPSSAPGYVTAYVDRRDVLSNGLVHTAEFDRHLTDNLYSTILDRRTGTGERDFWAHQLAAGTTPDSVRASLAGSNEFFRAAGGTDTGFVDAVYRKILGRSADAAGRAYMLGRLRAGDSPRSVAARLVSSDEGVGHHVVQAFQQVLSRTPDASTTRYWSGRFRTYGELSVLAQLGASNEFLVRFGH